MARAFDPKTLSVLSEIGQRPQVGSRELFKSFSKDLSYKEFYNVLFRLSQLELITKTKHRGELVTQITPEGKKLLVRKRPEPDGTWKLVTFDIPEKQKKVRTVLRAKLKSLGFKKWQNSLWISPYRLDEEVRAELDILAKRFFIRLLEVSRINRTDDLATLFPDLGPRV